VSDESHDSKGFVLGSGSAAVETLQEICNNRENCRPKHTSASTMVTVVYAQSNIIMIRVELST
jgi:hypothetical protein